MYGKYYDYAEEPHDVFNYYGIPVGRWFDKSGDVRQLHFNSIAELVTFVKADCTPDRYLFRGQNLPYLLRSSLNRCADYEDQKKRTDRFVNWLVNKGRIPLALYVQEFRAAYRDRDLVRLSDYSAAIAQHYGFPTMLMDWTWDIEVAAYFATSGDFPLDAAGVVFCLDVAKLKSSPFFTMPGSVGPRVIELTGVPRLEKQRGAFVQDTGMILEPFILTHSHMTFNHTERYRTDRINDRSIFPSNDWLDEMLKLYTDDLTIFCKGLQTQSGFDF